MATSWTRTREQMRDMIGRKLGILGVGQTMPAEDAAVVYEAMDARLKELHSLGMLWWQVAGATTNLTLSAGVATATVAPTDFLFPVSLMLPVGTSEQPVRIIGHREYQAIPDKTSQGEPEMAFFAGSTVYLWPVPQSGYTAKLTYQAIADDTAAGTRPDVPVAMLRSLASVIAFDLLEDFGVGGQLAATIAGKYPDAIKTIRQLNAERVDPQPITPEYL